MLVESVKRRFWKYTCKGLPSECWPWCGSVSKRGGYGQLNDRGKLLKAHRISFEIHNGLIPKDKFICHKCGNSICVNPHHLYAGTAKENIIDSKNHGTLFIPYGPRGESHHSAKLNLKKVKYIRNAKSKVLDLAIKFGVSKHTIYNVLANKIWKDANEI